MRLFMREVMINMTRSHQLLRLFIMHRLKVNQLQMLAQLLQKIQLHLRCLMTMRHILILRFVYVLTVLLKLILAQPMLIGI